MRRVPPLVFFIRLPSIRRTRSHSRGELRATGPSTRPAEVAVGHRNDDRCEPATRARLDGLRGDRAASAAADCSTIQDHGAVGKAQERPTPWTGNFPFLDFSGQATAERTSGCRVPPVAGAGPEGRGWPRRRGPTRRAWEFPRDCERIPRQPLSKNP